MNVVVVIAVFCGVFALGECQDYYQPEQIHLSYTEDPTEMMVTWNTRNDTNSSIVEYGTYPTNLTLVATGYRMEFMDGGLLKRTQFVHRVVVGNLTSGQIYWYHCGSNQGWSEVFYFHAKKTGADFSPRLAVFGDMGNDNPQSLPWLQQEAQRGHFDAVVHVGDIAYNMDSNNALVGDQFMRQIQPIAAYVPYMTGVGNHEAAYNFSNYKYRFTMPGVENNLYFAWSLGPARFISISTEFYFFVEFGFKQIIKQYKWLEKELQDANKPENRQARPWIILYGHRPMYCSNADLDDCTMKESIIRTGIPLLKWYGLEVLLKQYGVDIAIWAHEHSYERMWPMYNYTIVNGSLELPYHNPGATVHITTGSAGCDEQHDDFKTGRPPWTALRTVDYGYSRMTVTNTSHLHWEQVSVDQGGAVVDSVWISKTTARPNFSTSDENNINNGL